MAGIEIQEPSDSVKVPDLEVQGARKLGNVNTMQYLLQCPLLEQVCTAEDLAAYNDTAQICIQHWLNSI